MITAIADLRTPCYVIDLGLLKHNLAILADVQKRSGCKILLALKGYAAWSTFPLARQYLSGITASSLHEAMLGTEEFGKETHVYAPAYRDDEIDAYIEYADHFVFNSFSQWERFKDRIQSTGKPISCGIRVNPEHSEVKIPLYDPCAAKSRLGVTLAEFEKNDLAGIEGLHFHTLCERGADALERTLVAVEEKFGRYLPQMKWLNFGGGHHITREGYYIERLCQLIQTWREKYNVEIYLEPGEAVGLNIGYLVSSVLDILHNQVDIAILDTSAAAHMPDVIEMPYRPGIEGSGEPGEFPYTYKLGGLTCLAGDVIGDYSFPAPLHVGSRLIFHDMAHYTMVKNNTFNGVRLPDIVLFHPDTQEFQVVREFHYADYKTRLS
ncbi:carboxynorspermidine decarboxylase [bacterium]|nr:carboxynorspermidine decarboxylase [bacterium]